MPVQAGRVERRHGEARPETASDETGSTLHEHPGTGSAKSKEGTGGLLEAALTRQNLQTACKRVKANKGAAGVDGLDIEQTAQAIRTNWPQIRKALLAGRYRPSPVRKVMIPKPDGSQRELGIPTVLDRLIPDFPLACSSRVMGGEFDRQIELRGLIPKPLHPLSVLHGHSQVQDRLSAFCGGVGRLGK